MAIIGNIVAAITPSLRGLIQKFREEFAVHQEFQDGDTDVIESGLKTLNLTDGALLALAKEEELIQADEDASDEGKRKRMVKAVAQTFADLGFVQKTAKEKSDAAAQAKQKLEAIPKPSGDPVAARFDEWEVRERLRALPQPERMTIFAQAVANKNIVIRRALENDPLQEELIPREYVERVIQEHTQLTEGAQWQRLQTLLFVSERLTLLANALEYRLGNYGTTPMFTTPPIGKADLKMQDTQASPPKSKAADNASMGASFQ